MDSLEAGMRDAVLNSRVDIEDRINPFTYPGRMTPWEWVKVLIGIVVVPVRLVLMVVALMGMYLFSYLSISGAYDPTVPMGNVRRSTQYIAVYLSRVFLFFAGFLWISIKGKRSDPKDAFVYCVAPHSSAMDPFVLMWALRGSSAVAKIEVSKMPILGAIGKSLQTIYVERENKNAKANVLKEIKRRAEQGTWRHLVIFPEGTTTNRQALITFKKGPFVSGHPVQPVLMRWPNRFFDTAWTAAGPNRIMLVLRMLCQVYTNVEIEFCPIYQPSVEEKADPDVYARNVRAKMAKKLGVPTTEHSYEDMILAKLAKKLHLNAGEALPFEFQEMGKLVHLDLSESKQLLRRFAAEAKTVKKSAKQKAYTVDVVQFAKVMGLPLTEPVAELFGHFDVEGTGRIDFTSFLVGLSFISEKTNNDDTTELLFAALDSENTGKITKESLARIAGSVFRKFPQRNVDRLFAEADRAKTGFVDKEGFKNYIKSHSDVLFVGLRVKELFEERNRPLSILNKDRAKNVAEATEKNNSQKKAQSVERSALSIVPKFDGLDEQVEEVELGTIQAP